MSVHVPRKDALACFLCMCGRVFMWVYCVPPLMEVRDQLCSLGGVYLDFVFYGYFLCASVCMWLGTCAMACVWESEDNLGKVAFSFRIVVSRIEFRLLSTFTH